MIRKIIVIGLLGAGLLSRFNAMNTSPISNTTSNKPLSTEAMDVLNQLIPLAHDEGTPKHCLCCTAIGLLVTKKLHTILWEYFIQNPQGIVELQEHNPELWHTICKQYSRSQIHHLRMISEHYEREQRKQEGYEPPPLVLKGDHTNS